MATTNPTNRLKAGIRRYRGVISAAVQGITLLLRLPLVAHVLLTVVTELGITLVTGDKWAGH